MSDKKNSIATTEDEPKPEDHKSSENNHVSAIEPDLPPEAKKVLEIGMSGMSMHRFGPMPNPIAAKITEKHINKILDIAEKDDDCSFKDSKENRKFMLIYFLVFAALFVFSTVFLVGSDKELYKEVIKLFAVFLGGLGSGFGIKSYIDRKK
ncbi:Membrane protein DUF2335 [Candidatus Magnetomoraceae bacterium gMMP-15]